MHYYQAIVHKDENSAYGVTFPGLDGCFSAADSLEDVIPNACQALELWFEDAEETPPMEWAELLKVAADDLAKGAFLVAVPRIANDSRVVRANISLERGILDAIDFAAATRNLTRSAFIAQAARNEIEGVRR